MAVAVQPVGAQGLGGAGSTSTLQYYCSSTDGKNITAHGVVYGLTRQSKPGNVVPGSSGYTYNLAGSGTYTVPFYSTVTISLLHTLGNRIYWRPYVYTSTVGYVYGDELSFVVLWPAALADGLYHLYDGRVAWIMRHTYPSQPATQYGVGSLCYDFGWSFDEDTHAVPKEFEDPGCPSDPFTLVKAVAPKNKFVTGGGPLTGFSTGIFSLPRMMYYYLTRWGKFISGTVHNTVATIDLSSTSTSPVLVYFSFGPGMVYDGRDHYNFITMLRKVTGGVCTEMGMVFIPYDAAGTATLNTALTPAQQPYFTSRVYKQGVFKAGDFVTLPVALNNQNHYGAKAAAYAKVGDSYFYSSLSGYGVTTPTYAIIYDPYNTVDGFTVDEVTDCSAKLSCGIYDLYSASCSLPLAGFVYDTVPHRFPGNVDYGSSGYAFFASCGSLGTAYLGPFSKTLTGLKPDTTYYFRGFTRSYNGGPTYYHYTDVELTFTTGDSKNPCLGQLWKDCLGVGDTWASLQGYAHYPIAETLPTSASAAIVARPLKAGSSPSPVSKPRLSVSIRASSINGFSKPAGVQAPFALAEYGFVYGTVSQPPPVDIPKESSGYPNSATISGSSMPGRFRVRPTGLSPNTKYYARPYAKDSFRSNYGQEFSFTTAPGLLPSINLTHVGFPHPVYGTPCTVNITNIGGSDLVAYGVCWRTSTMDIVDCKSPQDYNTLSSSVAGGTVGTHSLSPVMSPGITYYVRAFAVNQYGCAYSSEEIMVKVRNLDNAYLNTDMIMVEYQKANPYPPAAWLNTDLLIVEFSQRNPWPPQAWLNTQMLFVEFATRNIMAASLNTDFMIVDFSMVGGWYPILFENYTNVSGVLTTVTMDNSAALSGSSQVQGTMTYLGQQYIDSCTFSGGVQVAGVNQRCPVPYLGDAKVFGLFHGYSGRMYAGDVQVSGSFLSIEKMISSCEISGIMDHMSGPPPKSFTGLCYVSGNTKKYPSVVSGSVTVAGIFLHSRRVNSRNRMYAHLTVGASFMRTTGPGFSGYVRLSGSMTISSSVPVLEGKYPYNPPYGLAVIFDSDPEAVHEYFYMATSISVSGAQRSGKRTSESFQTICAPSGRIFDIRDGDYVSDREENFSTSLIVEGTQTRGCILQEYAYQNYASRVHMHVDYLSGRYPHQFSGRFYSRGNSFSAS